MEATDTGMATVRQRLADVEATAAMTGGGPDKAVPRELLSLRDQRKFLAARIEGLQARLTAATAQVLIRRQEPADGTEDPLMRLKLTRRFPHFRHDLLSDRQCRRGRGAGGVEHVQHVAAGNEAEVLH